MVTDVAVLAEAAATLRTTLPQLRLDRSLPGADNAASEAESMLRELDDHVLPIDKARIMREGSDVTIVAYSIAVGLALRGFE